MAKCWLASPKTERLDARRGNAEDRRGLYNRVIVRERMESLDQHLSFARLDVHKTDRTKRKPPARVERMHQLVLRRTRRKLIVQHPKHLCRNLLELKLRTVLQAPFALNLLDVTPPHQGR